MRIELRRISVHERTSEETLCYAADLHVDGVKIGTVSNDGQGGADRFQGDCAARDAAEAWLSANGAPVDLGCGLGSVPLSLELYCGQIVTDWQARRDMRKALRSAALFVISGGPVIYESKYKGRKDPDAALFAHVRAKHPDATILNELSEEQALALYRKSTVAA